MTIDHAPAPNHIATDPMARQSRAPVALILGAVLTTLGLLLTAFAAITTLSSHGQRAFGSFATTNERYQVNTRALTLENLDAITGPGSPELGRSLGQVTVRATSATPGQSIFIGVAAQTDVSAYLTEVSHSELVDVRFDPFHAEYRDTAGSARPAPPGDRSFWTSSAQGPGTQQIEVDLRHGSWAVVVMNSDGHPVVAADLQAEVTLPWFRQATRAALLGGNRPAHDRRGHDPDRRTRAPGQVGQTASGRRGTRLGALDPWAGGKAQQQSNRSSTATSQLESPNRPEEEQ